MLRNVDVESCSGEQCGRYHGDKLEKGKRVCRHPRKSFKGLVHRFYERVRTSWAARRRDFERRVSFVMRDIVRAPIIVDTATIARFFASSGFASSIWPAKIGRASCRDRV